LAVTIQETPPETTREAIRKAIPEATPAGGDRVIEVTPYSR
jgi:hypothetical protein